MRSRGTRKPAVKDEGAGGAACQGREGTHCGAPARGDSRGLCRCARAGAGAPTGAARHRNQTSPWARRALNTVEPEFAPQRSQLTPTVLVKPRPAPSLHSWPLVLIVQVGTWETGKPGDALGQGPLFRP